MQYNLLRHLIDLQLTAPPKFVPLSVITYLPEAEAI